MVKERTCKGCGITGVEGAEFYVHQGNVCRRCHNKMKEDYRKQVQAEAGERHERRKEQLRIYAAKRKFGVTADEARALYATELCQICGGVNDSGKRLNIDHCHTTGRVRGVLCNRCNRGVGFFKDDPALLERASSYLREGLPKK